MESLIKCDELLKEEIYWTEVDELNTNQRHS